MYTFKEIRDVEAIDLLAKAGLLWYRVAQQHEYTSWRSFWPTPSELYGRNDVPRTWNYYIREE